ncbi:MAG TPA: rRNA pseudouridine synthase [Gemmatimonadetes bacterium]|nr:rRNA pseudouridine synthase [Gemmatimonadota bacterium]
MRIQKFLSRAGVSSRRKAETMVLEGWVRINGNVVSELGTKVDPDKDHVEVGGKTVRLREITWIRFHKPIDVLCTAEDTHGRKTLYDLLPDEHRALRYVGRLDLDTAGLLLLTNDGDLANRLIHPRYRVEREYEVSVEGVPSLKDIARLRGGIKLRDGLARPKRVEAYEPVNENGNLTIVMTEGRKREVRRMMYELGYPVVTMRRVRVGPVSLGDLPPGEWEPLSPEEVAALKRSTPSV